MGGTFAPQKNAHLALHVDDIDASRAELEAKGVEFIGETFDTGVCRMAFFKDPDGNDSDAAPPLRTSRPRMMDVERVDFVSFLTQDIARAKQFYAETLGLELESRG